ncbi:MAG: TlpA family protein disulfide reductase [Planctomycetes bacterium]|nr:TlpA family protein disulfide reductase [Planctomycetota bacterium]
MPHLNELDEKYRDKGLTVLALTSEGVDRTEAWIKAKGAEFAYAYDPGGLARQLGVRGIPASFLVGPDGKIVWQGHPSGVNDALVTQHLEGAITKPLYEWDGDAKKIKKAFLDGDFGKALAEAAKLAADDPFGEEAAKIVRRVLEGRVGSLTAALEKGDVLTAYEGAKALAKGLKGLPEEEAVDAIVTRISKDKDLKAQMKVQEKLLKITAEEPRRKKDCDEQMDDLKRLLKGHEGTFVGAQIEAKVLELFQLKGRLQY